MTLITISVSTMLRSKNPLYAAAAVRLIELNPDEYFVLSDPTVFPPYEDEQDW